MRYFLLFFIIFIGQKSLSQVNISGDAYYLLKIKGYQGKDKKACGGSFGLREINVFYGSSEINIWKGRIYDKSFEHTVKYTKNKKITKLYIRSENHYKNWGGANCHNGGSASHTFEIENTCYTIYDPKPMHVTRDVTIRSYPYVKFYFNHYKQYIIPSEENLKISLPDNLYSYHYKWKYRIAGGIVKTIPALYNYKAILDIPVSSIVKKEDYGKVISLWIDSECSATESSYSPDIFHFKVYLSGAKILASSKAVNPKCFDGKGSIVLNVDRTLLPKEENVEILLNDSETAPNNSELVAQLRQGKTVEIKDLLPGKYKVRIVGEYAGNPTYSDGNQAKDFEITAPTAVTFAKKSHLDVYCHGGSDGEIQLSADGGTPKYQYTIDESNWVDFTNGKNTTIPNLKAETYKIKVRDKNECIAKENGIEKTLTITLKQPQSPISFYNEEIVEPLGYGLSNGYIALMVKGGTPKSDGRYFYEWRKDSPTGAVLNDVTTSINGGFGVRLNNIGAGKYYLTLKDANYNAAKTKGNCGIISKEFIVNQPDPLKANISLKQSISCNPNNSYAQKDDNNNNDIPDEAEDGKIEVVVTGGVLPYKYQWQKQEKNVFTNLSKKTTPLLENISAGTYKVLITDKNNNTTFKTYTISFPSEIKLVLSKENLLCHGVNIGKASVRATGGGGSYTYKWNNGLTTPHIENLAAGKYEVIVTDGKQCPVSGKITITQPQEVFRIKTQVVTTPSGYGLANGEVKVLIGGGTSNTDGSYTYEWRKDSYNGAILTNTTAQATTTGYSIKLSSVTAGKYFLTIKDKNYNATRPMDCLIIHEEFEVTEPEPLKLDIIAEKHISCNIANNYNRKFDTDNNNIPDEAEDGVLKSIVTGGVQPYTYEWQKKVNGSFTTIKKGDFNKIEKLTEGNYKLKIVDKNGNKIEADKDLLFPPKLTVKLSKTDLVCHDINTGQVSSSVSGGTGSYTYSWNQKISSSSIEDLKAGKYALVVTDDNGCSVQDEVEVLQPKEVFRIKENSIQVKEPTGYGLTNGFIHLKVTGGTTEADGTYKYEWHKDSPNGKVLKSVTTKISPKFFSISLNTVGAGKYYLIVKDKNYTEPNPMECLIITKEFIVDQPAPLLSTINVGKLVSCNIANKYDYKEDLDDNGIPDEAEDGILMVQVNGGVGTYNYQWQKKVKNEFHNINNETNNILTKVTAGTYKIIVKDSNDNTTSSEYEMLYPQELVLNFSSENVKCYGNTDGVLSAKVTGGTGDYHYQWNTLENTAEIKNLSAGNYFLLVSDDNNCNVNGNISITQSNELRITEDSKIQNPLSPQASNGYLKLVIKGGKAPYSIIWSNGTRGAENLNLAQGKYSVSITDSNNCSIFKEFTLIDPDKIAIDLRGDTMTLCYGDYITYDVTINDTGAIYEWTNTKGEIISTKPKITIIDGGVYTIKITNSFGNTASKSVKIEVSDSVLQPEFLITTHAYVEESVMLVNSSKIKPDNVEWIIPQNESIQVITQSEEYIELKFSKVGSYKIGLKGRKGECEKVFYKEVIVEENTEGVEVAPFAISNIKEFVIVPNPNDGRYRVLIKLHKPQSIKLRVFSMTNYAPYTSIKQNESIQFEIPFNTTLSAGLYLIILETGGESQVKKMIVR